MMFWKGGFEMYVTTTVNVPLSRRAKHGSEELLDRRCVFFCSEGIWYDMHHVSGYYIPSMIYPFQITSTVVKGCSFVYGPNGPARTQINLRLQRAHLEKGLVDLLPHGKCAVCGALLHDLLLGAIN